MNREIEAALLSDAPDAFFRAAVKERGAMMPELTALVGVPQNPQYHPEGDAFEHTMRVLAEAARVRNEAHDPLAFMLAALGHDLGKAVSTKRNKKGEWASIGHENTGIPLLRALLERFGAPEETIAYCENMCRLHMRLHHCYYSTARVSRTNLLFAESVCPKELALLVICDARGTGKPRQEADAEERFVMERLSLYGAQ